ncbi:MAG TPA: hypothetical protein VFW65_32880 [Pseudonocardiaceae bacterium]|nr:hypothetical protein [Pseudonocardiaceae bacterium]
MAVSIAAGLGVLGLVATCGGGTPAAMSFPSASASWFRMFIRM